MKTRTTPLNTAVMAASIILLILSINCSAARWSLDPKPDSFVAGFNGKAESIFVDSLPPSSVVAGVYDLSFRVYRNGALEPVSSLPVGSGPLVLFAHVEDLNGNPAESGTVTFEYCGDYEPKETCDARSGTWTRLNRMSIGSCYCPSCGGLPGYDPGPGNACLFVTGTGNIPGDDGFRFKYAGGRRAGVDSGRSGAANFTWTAAL